MGNFLYHWLADPATIVTWGFWGSLRARETYVLYGVLLALGIWLSQLSKPRARPSPSPVARVATLSGARPGPLETFTRNALRLVDVVLLGLPLVLVVLSPLRQRVGDIAARTTVVRSASRGSGVPPERPPP